MARLAYLMLVAAMGYMPLCIADDSCCSNDNEEVEAPRQRGHVQLFFSGTPEVNVQDPREDYEWPGMNEDSFYDYFTK